MTFANCLNLDQDRQKVGPDLNPNRLTKSVPEDNLEKNNFEKKSADDNTVKLEKISQQTSSRMLSNIPRLIFSLQCQFNFTP